MKTLIIFLSFISLVSCNMSAPTNASRRSTEGGSTGGGTSGGSTGVGNCTSTSFGFGVPDWIQDNFNCVRVTIDGSNYKFETNDIPMHNSAYFPTDDSRYESSMPVGRAVNPNQISEQNYTFLIPITPVFGSGTATSLDAIGVATDGVVFYNNEAAPGDTLAAEIATLDNANAHPTNTGSYHYHIEPVEITNNDSKLIGVLRDGFPVFGRKCPATNDYPGNNGDSLDNFNGHIADTGITGLGTIYHYHVYDIGTDDGDGISEPVITDTYRGIPGTMTNN